MNTTPRPPMPLDPALMSAWLDKELDASDHSAVDAWLVAHPEDMEHVRRWAADRDVLRARMAPMLDEPLPDALRQLVLEGGAPASTPSATMSHWRMAAAAAGLLLAGGLVGAGVMWQAQRAQLASAQPRPVEWVQRAAVAHAVYTPEVRHPVEVNTLEGNLEEQRKNEEHLAVWLTRRVGMPVKLFNLRAQGFELVGGRLLPELPHKSAQLMYENKDKQRITVYLRKPDASTPAAFRFERQGELSLFYWVDGPTGYALVGNLPRERLLSLAQSIYEQGQAPAQGPAQGPVPAPAPPKAPATPGS
jgi:anti-sigma factor RsiW